MAFRKRLQGIYDGTDLRKHRIVALEVSQCGEDLIGVLKSQRPAGLIVEGGVLMSRHRRDILRLKGIPIVFCDADERLVPAGCSQVSHDSASTSRKVINELLGLDYHDYLFVGYFKNLDWSKAREAVFRKEMVRHGKCPHVLVQQKESVMTDLAEFTRQLRQKISEVPRPCGIFAANDAVGEAILNTLREWGRENDFAVVSIDDDELRCEHTRPTLASVAPAFEYSGRLAVRAVQTLLAGHRVRKVTKYGSLEVTRRESVRVDREGFSVRTAREFIRLNHGADTHVSDVAKAMKLELRTAQKHFKEATGRTIAEEMRSVRLTEVRKLLEHRSWPLIRVAESCGYRSERALRKFLQSTDVELSKRR